MSLSEQDRKVLGFVAGHEVVVGRQVARRMGWSAEVATGRLEQLAHDGLVSSVRIAAGRPPMFRVTATGRDLVDPNLPELARVDPGLVRRWLACGYLWLGSHEGGLGDARAVLSRREMIAADRADTAREILGRGAVGAFGVPLTPRGAVVYPDLAWLAHGKTGWIPVELALGDLDNAHLEGLLTRLEQDRLVGGVLVLADSDENEGRLRDLVSDWGLVKPQVRGLVPSIPDGSTAGL